MRVLFICSGTARSGISPILINQSKALTKVGISIEFFTIKKRGYIGYLKALLSLKRYIKKESFDIYHAHYGLSAITASMAGANPLVVSLMGSDVKEGGFQLRFIRILKQFRWRFIITKTSELSKIIGGGKKVLVIPNGVDLELFKPSDIHKSKLVTGLSANKKYILFAANPKRPEKNYQLAKKAFDKLSNSDLELISLSNIPNQQVPNFLNSSSIILLCSIWEGSPNVIKEAMACNCPIVATDVGDIKWVIGQTKGCYITSFDPEDVAEKIQMALGFNNRTQGRNRILELGLDSENIANKIIEVYKEVINEQKR